MPRISVVVRKAYGAGLYAMSGPGFNPNVTLVLPQAMIAVMGPEAAVNAVYFNKIQEQPEVERPAYVQRLRDEYRADVEHPPSSPSPSLLVDEIVPGDELRRQLRAAPRVLRRDAAGGVPAEARRAAGLMRRVRPCRTRSCMTPLGCRFRVQAAPDSL